MVVWFHTVPFHWLLQLIISSRRAFFHSNKNHFLFYRQLISDVNAKGKCVSYRYYISVHFTKLCTNRVCHKDWRKIVCVRAYALLYTRYQSCMHSAGVSCCICIYLIAFLLHLVSFFSCYAYHFVSPLRVFFYNFVISISWKNSIRSKNIKLFMVYELQKLAKYCYGNSIICKIFI